jgi:hypothetical protein
MITDVMSNVERYGIKYPKPYKYKVKKIDSNSKPNNDKKEKTYEKILDNRIYIA